MKHVRIKNGELIVYYLNISQKYFYQKYIIKALKAKEEKS
jgi:hypothetical protein